MPGFAGSSATLFEYAHDARAHLPSRAAGDRRGTYFRWFGTLYCLDGLLGLVTGSGYLDLGIFLHGVLDLPFTTRVLMNLPHIAIGGFAAFTGFVLARRWAPHVGARRATGAHR